MYIILYDKVFPVLLNFHESSKMDNQLLLKIAPIKKFSFLSSMEDWPVTFLILQRPFEILLGNYFNYVHSNVFFAIFQMFCTIDGLVVCLAFKQKNFACTLFIAFRPISPSYLSSRAIEILKVTYLLCPAKPLSSKE